MSRGAAPALGTERFKREIGLAARLSHPHIVPLFDSGEVDGHFYSIMPFVKGESYSSSRAIPSIV